MLIMKISSLILLICFFQVTIIYQKVTSSSGMINTLRITDWFQDGETLVQEEEQEEVIEFFDEEAPVFIEFHELPDET